MQFDTLLSTSIDLHNRLRQQDARQTDQLMTLRNWLFGLYIVGFEQNGKERTVHGQNVIPFLADSFKKKP